MEHRQHAVRETRDQYHRARIDTHVNVSTWLPEVMVVPEPNQSEADSAIKRLQAGRINVYDRGFVSLALLKAHHHTPNSNFVVRFKPEGNNAAPIEVTLENELAEEDLAAGGASDRVGRFATQNAERAERDVVRRHSATRGKDQDGERLIGGDPFAAGSGDQRGQQHPLGHRIELGTKS